MEALMPTGAEARFSAGDLWSRFVTEFPEDQDLLAQESAKRFNFRPIITNYSGNTQEVIRHRLGEASTFAQCAPS